ncbi:tetratricopeptide repeat protein 4, partial [Nephila pilipes]
TVS